ncbi:MAG: hypothetical protein KDA61_10815, partial [Planctomycetales bacterium]|nr:hypothetical protein [Planctomycetales bacterium]
NPWLQAIGYREAARDALCRRNDRPAAMREYERFIAVLAGQPPSSPWTDHMGEQWLDLNSRRGTLVLTNDEAGRHWGQVIQARWSTDFDCPRSSQPWERRIRQTALRLERAGRAFDADALYARCSSALTASLDRHAQTNANSAWIETRARLDALQTDLRSRHEDLWTPRPKRPTVEVAVRRRASADELLAGSVVGAEPSLQRGWTFEQVLAIPSGYAAVCVHRVGTFSDPLVEGANVRVRAAVIRLDSELRLVAAEISPTPFDFDYRRILYVGNSPNYRPPTAAAVGDDVFFAPPANGLVWFRPTAPPVHFSTRNLLHSGDTARPAPFEHVSRVLETEGRLILLTGDGPETAKLLEFNFATGFLQTLLDAAADDAPPEVRARIGFVPSIGPPGSLAVWTWPNDRSTSGAGRRQPGRQEGDLLLYRFDDASLRPASRSLRSPSPWPLTHSPHCLARGRDASEAAILDLRTLDFSPPFGVAASAIAEDSAAFNSSTRLSQIRCVYNAQTLLTPLASVGGLTPGERRSLQAQSAVSDETPIAQWALYTRRDSMPKLLSSASLPDPDATFDFRLMSPSQALMATMRELLIVDLSAAIPR